MDEFDALDNVHERWLVDVDEFDALAGKDALYDEDDTLKTLGRAILMELRTRYPVGWSVLKLQASGYALRHSVDGFRSIDVKVSRSSVLVDENIARSLSRKLEVEFADPAMMEKLFETLDELLSYEKWLLSGPEV